MLNSLFDENKTQSILQSIDSLAKNNLIATSKTTNNKKTNAKKNDTNSNTEEQHILVAACLPLTTPNCIAEA